MLAVWLAFLVALWVSRGALAGYPAFILAVAAAAALWWRWSWPRSCRAGILHALAMVVALAPLAYELVPLASSTLAPLPASAAVQMWQTGADRSLAVYHYPAAADWRSGYRAWLVETGKQCCFLVARRKFLDRNIGKP